MNKFKEIIVASLIVIIILLTMLVAKGSDIEIDRETMEDNAINEQGGIK